MYKKPLDHLITLDKDESLSFLSRHFDCSAHATKEHRHYGRLVSKHYNVFIKTLMSQRIYFRWPE